MGDNSKIEWTDATWGPIRARNKITGQVGWFCIHASEGCRNCYAERMNLWRGTGLPYLPKHLADIELFLDEETLTQPLRWTRPRMIFVCSMTDLFADFVKQEWIERIFDVMARAKQHTFQVLTKRAYQMLLFISSSPFHYKPLENVWLGFSAEDDQTFHDRWQHACNIAAWGWRVWCSAEPLVGPIDGYYAMRLGFSCANCGDGQGWEGERCSCGDGVYSENPTLAWMVVGGESGPKARPMNPYWASSLRDQCVEFGIPFHFKQWGEWLPFTQLDPSTEAGLDMAADCDTGRYPEHLWFRDVPGGQVLDGTSYRVGKGAAGRLLDGRTWDEYPSTEQSQ